MSPYCNILIILMIVNTSGSSTLMKQQVIYVDPINGTAETSCWNGGLEMPCSTLEVAIQGARKMKNVAIMTLTPTKLQIHKQLRDNATECPTWMNYNHHSGQCECGDSLHGAVKCNTTLDETYIMDCYIITYDDKLKDVIAGHSFYGCVKHTFEDGIYHKVPSSVSSINDVMCKPFNKSGRLCGSCLKG